VSVIVRVNGHLLIAPYYGMNLFLEHSDMAHDSKGITQFNLPPTHEPYLSLILSHTAIPPFGWYSIAHAHGGMARLS